MPRAVCGNQAGALLNYDRKMTVNTNPPWVAPSPEGLANAETRAHRTQTPAKFPQLSRPAPPDAGSELAMHNSGPIVQTIQLQQSRQTSFAFLSFIAQTCARTCLTCRLACTGSMVNTFSRKPRKVPCFAGPTPLLGCAVNVRSGTSYTISSPAPTCSCARQLVEIILRRKCHRPRRPRSQRQCRDAMRSACALTGSHCMPWEPHLWPLIVLAPVERLGCEVEGAVELAAQLHPTNVRVHL